MFVSYKNKKKRTVKELQSEATIRVRRHRLYPSLAASAILAVDGVGYANAPGHPKT